MKILVCGSRGWWDRQRAYALLDQVRQEKKEPLELVIEGGAGGGDAIGHGWARMRGIPVRTVPAQWDVHGKSAGFRRNEEMVNMLTPGVDVCVALWDGQSRGTQHTMGLCRRRGIEVYTA